MCNKVSGPFLRKNTRVACSRRLVRCLILIKRWKITDNFEMKCVPFYFARYNRHLRLLPSFIVGLMCVTCYCFKPSPSFSAPRFISVYYILPVLLSSAKALCIVSVNVICFACITRHKNNFYNNMRDYIERVYLFLHSYILSFLFSFLLRSI